jgi:hypothetical protein
MIDSSVNNYLGSFLLFGRRHWHWRRVGHVAIARRLQACCAERR